MVWFLVLITVNIGSAKAEILGSTGTMIQCFELREAYREQVKQPARLTCLKRGN